ncbi:Hsp70 family protein [Tropicimonas sediminicola]|uniref:Uncharacterized protein n=1 Tax=Tropicimonas sediminicola TaxID=1031541 RepID=A0A239MDE9_9RHOB|nr:molecular chaperone [Tropicimonas sediminicola]SNT40163.1 hypothetical protein SAMN05421757_1169 [Tropicimonas sediminicola]
MKKKLLINQVKVARIQDGRTIPTKVAYQGRKFKIGRHAEDSEDCDRLFENFKVELGRQTREQLRTQKQEISKVHSRTVVGIAKDFLEGVCDEVFKNTQRDGYLEPKKVLVAEPISFEEEGKVSGEWLSNYRFAVRSALQSKFQEVDFLPEPFAVFQYYRYGFRHPLLSENAKHIALVLDFGGGTFDVSVIETTNTGDISGSGANSRPLAAKSIPVGGYFVNQKVAERLLFSNIDDAKTKRRARDVIDRVERSGGFLGVANPAAQLFGEHEQAFVQNFRNLLREVEGAKVRICNSVSNWDLTAELGTAVSHLVNVPIHPFDSETQRLEFRITANDLREVFISNVWQSRLRDAVKRALQRAEEELRSRPISVVLLSGGSTNIGWTKELIERDLAEHIADADVLEISENYQEVVAKGLAVECARQYFTEGDGDFGAVTYNRLNLALRTDEGELELCPFSPRTQDLPRAEDKGTLLASASSLRAFLDKPISWKARLKRAPKQQLEYHYLKSSYDPNDLDSVHNIGVNRVRVPTQVFGQSIDIELTVREDGTATPAFLLNRGKRNETRIAGDDFYLDMTFAGQPQRAESYMGLDFGTATSAASLVFQSDVKAYKDRERQKAWTELNDLVEILPYCIAHPLGNYMAQTEAHLLEKFGKRTLEAMLSFVAYICYCDVASLGNGKTPKLSAAFNRSAGPLKNLITNLSQGDLSETLVASRLLSILQKDFMNDLSLAIQEVNNIKHDRAVNVDFNYLLGVLGNHIKQSLGGIHFGNFESMRKDAFGGKYSGTFRSMRGSNAPFVELSNYSGAVDFASELVFLVDEASKTAISVSPFFLSGDVAVGTDTGKCNLLVLDGIEGRGSDFSYIPVQEGKGLKVGDYTCLDDLKKFCAEFFIGNGPSGIFRNVELSERHT